MKLVWCNSPGFTMVDLFQDFMDSFCPYEWLGVFVVVTEVVLDDLDELVHAFEDPSANLFAGDFSKPSFHQVQPG